MKREILDKRLKNSLNELAKQTDKAKISEEMTNFFSFCSQFHKHSWSNLWLIYSHKPNATRVAGFDKWKDFGRWVSGGKGCGIPIYAPLKHKEINDDGKEIWVVHGFKVVYVYDVSDTDGKPLPEPPDWKSPQKQEELSSKLKAFCTGKGITVEEKELNGETQGYSSGGKIVLSPNAGVKTFIHEITHELLHQVENAEKLSSKLKELEAEACAYIVAKHFGVEDLNSANYIALHHNKGDDIKSHFKRILKPAIEIIKFVDPEMEVE